MKEDSSLDHLFRESIEQLEAGPNPNWDKAAAWNELEARMDNKRRGAVWWWWSGAACILLLVSVGIFWFKGNSGQRETLYVEVHLKDSTQKIVSDSAELKPEIANALSEATKPEVEDASKIGPINSEVITLSKPDTTHSTAHTSIAINNISNSAQQLDDTTITVDRPTKHIAVETLAIETLAVEDSLSDQLEDADVVATLPSFEDGKDVFTQLNKQSQKRLKLRFYGREVYSARKNKNSISQPIALKTNL